MPDRPTRAIERFAWPILIVWVVALAAAGLAATQLPHRLSGGGWYAPGSESAAAAHELATGLTGRGASNITLVVRDEQGTVASPDFGRRVGSVIKTVTNDERLQVTGSYGWQTVPDDQRGRFIGKDQRTVVTQLGLRLDDGTARRILPGIQRHLADRFRQQGLKVAFAGTAALGGEVAYLSLTGLARTGLFALPLLLIILLWLHRGVVAAVVSLVVPGTAIGCASGMVALLDRHFEISVFAGYGAVLAGLGVGVDYSLLVLARRAGLGTGENRSVLASGLIVVPATACLFLVDLNAIRSLALGIVLAVGFALLAALVVLPAVLHLLGERWRPPARTQDGSRPAGQIARRPVAYLAAAVAVMAVLAVPAFTLRTFTPDARILPASSPVRFGYDAVTTGFGRGAASPIRVVAHSATPLESTPGYASAVAALNDRLASLRDIARLDSPLPVLRAVDQDRPFGAMAALPAAARQAVGYFVSADHRTVVLEVVPRDTAAGPRARELLTEIRGITHSMAGPVLRIDVGGETAEGVDADQVLSGALPVVLIAMMAVLYVLLLLVLRSAVRPLTVILANLLSIGAAYGVLVLLFQHLTGQGHVQNFVPIMLAALLVGLGAGRADARTAVLMVAVFGCFAVTPIMPIQQLGVGAAVIVALDAVITRLAAVPASTRPRPETAVPATVPARPGA
jgi:RND superfamily putative drug exporter